MQALQIAATGMNAQQTRVDTVSNNLANMSTTAYNARRAEFADLHYEQKQAPGTINAADGTVIPTGVQLGMGTQASAVGVNLQQGALTETRADLDIAIEGAGYLEVELPAGLPAYTRDGGLHRSADGAIVTADGYEVMPGIVIPDDALSLSIGADGEVFAYFDDEVEPEFLGQITLAAFANEKGLQARGSNLFIETAASGPALIGAPGQDGLGTLRQGYLEDSSVDSVAEVTELIKAQRGYELNAKVITAADQMLAATTQVR